MTQKLIFITAGSSWTPPADCFQLDWVDCIGGGGGAVTNGSYNPNSAGAGGAWSRSENLKVVPNNSISLNVGSAGTISAHGGDTWFNATSAADAVSKGALNSCLARGGQSRLSGTGAVTVLGGQASGGVGAQKYSGGNGTATSSAGTQASGGGAAGPNGNGNSGTTAQSPGGSGDAGFGGHGGAWGSSTVGSPGGNGTEYDASHGSGGGGGGAGFVGAGKGGNGGLYGGGAGVGISNASSTGAQGLIVIAYTPFKGAPGGFNMPMMGI